MATTNVPSRARAPWTFVADVTRRARWPRVACARDARPSRLRPRWARSAESGIAGVSAVDGATLERFAELIVRFAANVQRGQIVAIGTEPGKLELTRAVAAAAYRAGAKFVDVTQFDLHVKRARILHADEETLDYVPPWFGERILALGEHRAARIGLTGPSAPGLLERPRPAARRARPAAVPARGERGRQRAHDELDGRAVPDAAVGVARVPRPRARTRRSSGCGSRSCTCAGSTSPIRSPRGGERQDVLVGVSERLTELRFDALHFEGPGTDLRVGLLPTSRWLSARFQTIDGIDHMPNLPSEEVFTAPDPRARRRRGALDEAARRRRHDRARPARALRGRPRGVVRGRRGRRAARAVRAARRGRVPARRGRARRRRGAHRPARHGLLRHAHRRERRVARRARARPTSSRSARRTTSASTARRSTSTS